MLIVEDEPLIRWNLREALEEAGLEAVEAEDVPAALKAMDKESGISLVISDIHLPGNLNGMDLCRRIGKLHPGIRVVLTSGRTRPDLRDTPPGTLFIEKPYNVDRLVALARTALSS